MCGLVLVITKNKNGFNNQQQDVFNTLLYLSGHFRGRDGAGIVSVDNIGNVKMAKGALTVDAAMQTKEYAEVQAAAYTRGWALFGHNRSATKGSITDANSHPFVADDNIVLVHNGTFAGDHKALKDSEVDSEAIAHVLSEKNVNIEHSLRKINAAYALIWYNVEKRQLHVVRNLARPLWYMETHDSYIYASEEPFLQFVKQKFKLTTTRNPFEIKEYNLSTYTLDDNKNTTYTAEDIDSSYYKHNQTGGTTSHGAPFLQREENVFGGGGGKPHPYACAYWGGNDELDSYDRAVLALPPNVIRLPQVIDTRESSMKDRVIAALGKTITGITMKAWKERQTEYTGSNKVRVIVNDLVEADDIPKTDNFLMIGRTLDRHQLPVVFPLRGTNFEKVMELSSDAVFEIDYSGITWQRVNEIPIVIGKNMEEWEGFALMHGVNPTPIYMAKETASAS